MEKINVAEILKDAPIGMELYSPIYGVGVLTKVTDRIHVKFPKEHNVKCFRLDGKVSEDGEIMLYPKGKTTWEGFVPPIEFKNGDVIYVKDAHGQEWYSITDKSIHGTLYTYVDICINNNELYRRESGPLCICNYVMEHRLATEEEKQKLFDAIKANGYKWNEETKTLETWEGFLPPCKFSSPCKFKNGDIIYVKDNRYQEWCSILNNFDCKNDKLYTYVDLRLDGKTLYRGILKIQCYCKDLIEYRIATEKEKEKLFKAIKDNGYRWDEETKTLMKLPTFKVGDRVKSKINQYEYTIADICKDVYIMYYATDKFGYHVPFCNEDNFELVSNKFDITTLKPFESRVLVRDADCGEWRSAFWGHLRQKRNIKYDTTRGVYRQCIPYEGNEHLLGKTDDCDEYYKTWE